MGIVRGGGRGPGQGKGWEGQRSNRCSRELGQGAGGLEHRRESKLAGVCKGKGLQRRTGIPGAMGSEEETVLSGENSVRIRDISEALVAHGETCVSPPLHNKSMSSSIDDSDTRH